MDLEPLVWLFLPRFLLRLTNNRIMYEITICIKVKFVFLIVDHLAKWI